jgi:hypothetical protein
METENTLNIQNNLQEVAQSCRQNSGLIKSFMYPLIQQISTEQLAGSSHEFLSSD